MFRFRAATLAASLVLCSFVPAFAGDVLTATQIRQLAPGSYDVSIMDTIDLTVRINANGSIIGEAQGQHDTGRWHVAGNQLCIAWKKWLGGEKRCSTLTSHEAGWRGQGFTLSRI